MPIYMRILHLATLHKRALHWEHSIYWHVQVIRVQELIRQVGLAPTKAKNICSMSKVSHHLPAC